MKMTLPLAMAAYANPDKVRFPSFSADDSTRPNSTFFADFCVAECYGVKAIRDTYKRCKAGWKDNAKMWTECTVCLNHLLWDHYNDHEEELARLYDGLWKDADAYAHDHFKDDDALHYFKVTD